MSHKMLVHLCHLITLAQFCEKAVSVALEVTKPLANSFVKEADQFINLSRSLQNDTYVEAEYLTTGRIMYETNLARQRIIDACLVLLQLVPFKDDEDRVRERLIRSYPDNAITFEQDELIQLFHAINYEVFDLVVGARPHAESMGNQSFLQNFIISWSAIHVAKHRRDSAK